MAATIMTLLEKIQIRFTKTNTNDNYYHESGHVIFAKLFTETFKVEYVTLDLATTKKQDILFLGGLKCKFAIPVSDLTIYDHDKAIMTMLAGMCIDDINNYNGKINSSFYRIPPWAAKFNELRYQGDVKLIISHFDKMKSVLNITWQEYISNTLKITHDILLDSKVWKSVNALRKELIKSENSLAEIAAAAGFYDQSHFTNAFKLHARLTPT
ncbi:MAG: AraC family transcriptional regulator, partial [Flavisolibacter sp.]|nr:AraC family transcriptional regulator [Flavisolibacter sp.]